MTGSIQRGMMADLGDAFADDNDTLSHFNKNVWLDPTYRSLSDDVILTDNQSKQAHPLDQMRSLETGNLPH